MDIKELTENYTREEIERQMKESNYGTEIYGIFDERVSCPRHLGLTEIERCTSITHKNCKECWVNAIKDLQFKNELIITKDNEEIVLTALKTTRDYLIKDIDFEIGLLSTTEAEIKRTKESLEKLLKNEMDMNNAIDKKKLQLDLIDKLIEKEGN